MVAGTIRVRTVAWSVTAGALALIAMCLVLMQAFAADAAAGDADATFVPLAAPCRLIDTRPAPDRVGPKATLGAGDTETIQATGTNGNCVIPAEAVGLSLNVTALNATAGTFLTFWPDGAQPRVSSLNPTPGQPPIPNAVTVSLSGAGAFNVFNKFGTVDMVIDVNGFYTKKSLQNLEARLDALESSNTDLTAKVAALETKLAAVSMETVDGHPTVRFTGVNVQVIDGSGTTVCTAATTACTGVGNLIIGYNEDTGTAKARTGSHNLALGTANDWTSHSGIIAGSNNTATGEYATITGGAFNTASGDSSSVSGGFFSKASAFYSSVSGGSGNTASGERSSVSGGSANMADGFASSVSAGESNTASESFSAVSGGVSNAANGDYSSVSGGDTNIAEGSFSSVSGGFSNTASGARSAVSGGAENESGGSKSSVSGGSGRDAPSTFDWAAGTLFEDQ